MPDADAPPELPPGTPPDGRVVCHHGVAVLVELRDGTRRQVSVARGRVIRVGDEVCLRDHTVIPLPPRTVLRRRDSRGRVREIAANLDEIGLVVASEPPVAGSFIDRGLVAARAAGIEPFIVVNKIDLEDGEAFATELEERYAGSVAVLRTQATSGEGVEALRGRLAEPREGGGPKTTALVGKSGVGKSSLVNALLPDLDLSVGDVNRSSGHGRHTTTTALLERLPEGGELIDTPGFRDFGPVEVTAADYAAHFPGFERVLEEGCRFRDCLHRSEPGCVVLAAVEAGEIDEARHRRYLGLLAEIEGVEKDERGY